MNMWRIDGIRMLQAAAWTLWSAPVILLAVLYSCKNYKFKRKLVELRHSIDAIDANLAEIRKLRDAKPKRDDVAAVERAQCELDDIDLAALADYLQLTREFPKA